MSLYCVRVWSSGVENLDLPESRKPIRKSQVEHVWSVGPYDVLQMERGLVHVAMLPNGKTFMWSCRTRYPARFLKQIHREDVKVSNLKKLPADTLPHKLSAFAPRIMWSMKQILPFAGLF